jgi:hypothetical protein
MLGDERRLIIHVLTLVTLGLDPRGFNEISKLLLAQTTLSWNKLTQGRGARVAQRHIPSYHSLFHHSL